MTTSEPKIKAVAPWAGGKRKLAKRIIAELGEHVLYIEPFVGGCSILFQKPRAEREILADMNPKVVNALCCLRDYPNRMHAQLEDAEFSKETYDAALSYLDAGEKWGPDAASAQLVVWWMGANGMAGTTTKPWFARRNTKTGGDPAVRWKSFVGSISALSERLAGTDDIYHSSWQYILPSKDKKRTAIYCDPPYLSKSFVYENDFSADDHIALAYRLGKYVETRVVVSYRVACDSDAAILADLYPRARWRWIEIEQSKNMASASGNAKRNVELILVTGGQ